MSALTFDTAPNAALTIDWDQTPQVELNGGQSSFVIEQNGTTVQIFGADPDVTDLLAQYRLLSN